MEKMGLSGIAVRLFGDTQKIISTKAIGQVS